MTAGKVKRRVQVEKKVHRARLRRMLRSLGNYWAEGEVMDSGDRILMEEVEPDD